MRESVDICQAPLEELLEAGEAAIRAALDEDLRNGDPASSVPSLATRVVRAQLIAKADGVIAGLPVAECVFRAVDVNLKFDQRVRDGVSVCAGEIVATVEGRASSILAAERTALNFVQRLSGIATLTATYVNALAATCTILRDTRKTAPTLRALDKYAVRVGGGLNHRYTLGQLAMIKDSHIDAAGDL
jgi:nicotinate-nucleotide pyrophosphorylase (carboxylating)